MNEIYNAYLSNINEITSDFRSSGIDLIDQEKKLGFQITSTNTQQKVDKTISKICTHNIDSQISKLFIVILRPKKNKIKINQQNSNLGVEIIDINDIFIKINSLRDFDKISFIAGNIEKEIGVKIENYFKYGIPSEHFNENVSIIDEFAQQYKCLLNSFNISEIVFEKLKSANINDLINEILNNIKFQRVPIAENYFILAQISEMLYDYENAQKYYEKAYENAPKNIEFISELINFYYIIGEPTKAFKLIPTHQTIIQEQGLLISEIITDLENRILILQQQGNKYKELTYLMNLSGLYGWNGDIEKAEKLLRTSYEYSKELLTDNHKRTESIKHIYELNFGNLERLKTLSKNVDIKEFVKNADISAMIDLLTKFQG